jgi:DNA-binding NtrC family response regulator
MYSKPPAPDATRPPKGQSRPASILVVDGDPQIRKLLHFNLKRSGSRVFLASGGEEALEVLRQVDRIDLVLLDLQISGMPALDLLRALNQTRKIGSIIAMTQGGGLADAIVAMREGAYDVVSKTYSFDEVQLSIRNALQTQGLRQEVEQLKARLDERERPFSEVIAESEAMALVLKLARKVCDSDITVLLEGESGSGKEVIAGAIHREGSHRDRPFVAINCAAIPENLLESELFGYEKGAFTGATQRRLGKFAEADEGTLFLDEIGELSPALQAKLLRVLQTKEVQPIGGQPNQVNVRIISASNQDLLAAVKAGLFRLDLYYRLAVFPIRIPPLRERRDDIAPLLEHFVAKFAQQEGRQPLTVEREVVTRLLDYDWPGNVRELENMIYRAVVLTEDSTLRLADFPVLAVAPLVMRQTAPAVPEAEPPAWPMRMDVDRNAALPGASLEEAEQQAIAAALQSTRGNISQAALRLKIGRATLYRKVKKYGIGIGGQPESPV